MSISLIPDSAPFTTEQRAWLNGFLAGMVGLSEDQQSAAVATLDMPALEQPEEEEEFPYHDPALDMDERLEMTKEKPLKRKLMAAMAQLDCGACGYVCQTYSEAIASGEETNLSLCSPGGKPTAKMLKKLLAEQGEAPETAAPAAAAPAEQGWTRKNPYPAKLICSYNLNGEGSSKHTSHVEIDLGESELKYNVGDALGVYPTNCPDLVSKIIETLQADAEQKVDLGGEHLTLQNALTERFCLRDATEELVEELIGVSTQPEVMEKLPALIDSDTLDDMDVLDLLEYAGKPKLDASNFLRALSPLQPRLYSIASSQRKNPNQVHLTVGRVETTHAGRPRKGVASTMFSDRLAEQGEVKVFVQASHGFTVPPDPATPLIMVGPGTGIAPFRAFLQERQALKSTGPNWLFFGDQHASCDYLYEEELNALADDGVLTKVSTAFSRDQEEKIYVQNRMLESGAEIWDWINQGGWFCVCGDAKRMAVDVDKALHKVIETHGKMTEQQAKDYVKQMSTEGRYGRDVY